MSTLQTYNLKHPDASGNQIVFTSGGDINFDNGAVYLDSANNRLGVGDSDPNFTLDVNGGVGIREDNNLTFHDGAGVAAFRIRGTSDNKLFFERASGNEHQMVIDDGKVGIGNTTVADVLHVQTNATGRLLIGPNGASSYHNKIYNDNGDLMISSEGSSSDMIVGSARDVIFRTAGTAPSNEVARFKAGTLLVGTSTSNPCKIQLSNGNNAGPYIETGGTNRNANGLSKWLTFRHGYWGGSQEVASIGVVTTSSTGGSGHGYGDIVFHTGESGNGDSGSTSTERLRISASGVVNISNGRLYAQASTGSPLCFVYNTNNVSNDNTYRSDLGVNANGTSAYHFYAETGGAGKFGIYGNGTFGTISDERLKNHIEPARNGYLDDLNKLKIVKYGWKIDELDHATELGVIAQDVETVFPGLIQDTPPKEDGETFKGVKSSVFTYILIKALQEASAKIEALEQRLADAGIA